MTTSGPVPLSIIARDGFQLAGSIYHTRDEAKRVVIINSATGTPRRFYRHFAGSLVAAGYTVVSYDYRGIGDSRPESLRRFSARMRDWAFLDMASVVDQVSRQFAPARLFLVGHSVGGQVAGMLDNAARVDGMVAMSSQSGYWRLQGGIQKLIVAIHVHLTLPLLAKLFGYVPMSLLGAGEDLPAEVALEWARWCRDPRYLLGDDSLPLDRFGRFAAPVLAYSFSDDDWGTRESVEAMMSAYPEVEFRHVVPEEKGLESIGHFGYFRPEAARLWDDAVEWLDAH